MESYQRMERLNIRRWMRAANSSSSALPVTFLHQRLIKLMRETQRRLLSLMEQTTQLRDSCVILIIWGSVNQYVGAGIIPLTSQSRRERSQGRIVADTDSSCFLKTRL